MLIFPLPFLQPGPRMLSAESSIFFSYVLIAGSTTIGCVRASGIFYQTVWALSWSSGRQKRLVPMPDFYFSNFNMYVCRTVSKQICLLWCSCQLIGISFSKSTFDIMLDLVFVTWFSMAIYYQMWLVVNWHLVKYISPLTAGLYLTKGLRGWITCVTVK